jgi:hypothetical protein
MVLYRDLFARYLPRTTSEQVTEGEAVSPDELQAGDLVFFQPSKSQHVGIYLSDGEFAHASSSQGVTVSEINDPYWRRTYWTARRVLDVGSLAGASDFPSEAEEVTYQNKPRMPEVPPPPAHAPPQPRAAERVGW